MNLTLASHHHPHSYPHMGSMDQLECREGLTKKWLLDQHCAAAAAAPSSYHIPLPRLLSSSRDGGGGDDVAALGTTFPPQAHMLHAFRERLRQIGGRNTCHSEPDLSHGLYGLDNREADDDEDDDDRLFEFDLDDDDDGKNGDKDFAIENSKHHQLTENIEQLDCAPQRKFSISSDGSAASCQHRKGSDETVPDGEVGSDGGPRSSSGYIGSLFGSRSSGIGSERRSSQETVSEPEGLSFEPDQWRDYMLDRMSNDGSTPSASATSLASSDGGNVTPIMAASPAILPDVQPLVSPDSLLDPLEECQAAAACPKCEQEQQLLFAENGHQEEEELELVVEIRDTEVGGSYVASMVPLGGGGGHEENSISDSKEDTKLNTEAFKTVNDLSEAIVAEPVVAEASNEDEENSEADYAKEEEPEVAADAHLMADIEFSQQKLHELLDQLEKQNRYPATCTPREPQEDTSCQPSPLAAQTEVAVIADAVAAALSTLTSPAQETSLSPVKTSTAAEAAADIDKTSTPERNSNSPTSYHEISEHIDRAKLRKCSSLKSGRTPPGTPGVRKIVRFADIFGLDLQEVKTFTDEIPRIPRKAFQDLDVDMSDYDIGSPRGSTPVFSKFFCPQPQKPQNAPVPAITSLVPMFNQPGGASNFFDTVVSKKVSLENAYMESPTIIAGIVRVLNIDYHKAVTVRWTVNDWSTFNDLAATYVPGSSDGFSDKFSFRLCLGCLPVGSRIQFCLRYNSSGAEFWDSNNGTNYVFQVFLTSNSPGGMGGVNFRTTPLSISPRSQFTTAHQSPSQHGDDPWLRFM